MTLQSPMKSLGEFVFQLSFNIPKRTAHGRLHKHWHEFSQLQQAQNLEKSAPGTARTLRLRGQQRAAEMKSDVDKSLCNHLSASWALVCEAIQGLRRK